MSSCVAIVAESAFGDNLITLAASVPVWVADTPANRAVVDRARVEVPGLAVTTFRVDFAKSPEEWAAGVLGPVLEHHGASSRATPVDELEIHGVAVTGALREELAARGFAEITNEHGVITARRAPAA